MNHLIRPVMMLFAAAALAACGDPENLGSEYAEDRDPSLFSAEAKADGLTLEEGSGAASGVLRVANELSFGDLDDVVKLDVRAARNIVADRDSQGSFATLRELDAVKYVGVRAITKMHTFAQASGWVVEPEIDPDVILVNGVAEGSDDAERILAVANGASLEALDVAAALDRRAAANIFAARAEGAFADLATLDAVPYVGTRAFGRLLAYFPKLVVEEPDPAADAVQFSGPEQCSGQAHGSSYTFSVLSNPPRAETDLRISLRFNSSSPYSPRPQELQLEVAPDRWSTVFTTTPAVSGWTRQTFNVGAATANAAAEAMGWLRFRVYPGTAYTACSQLDVTYNCPECFACPEGQEDVGFGCQDVGAPFDQTLLDHSRGLCSRNSATLTFISAPAAGSDGRLSLQYLPCDGGRINLAINTQNAGWVDIGSDSTGMSCGFKSATLNIPEAFLDAARSDDGEIEIRYSISDSCRPGMGCASHNDPCVRRVNLRYEQE